MPNKDGIEVESVGVGGIIVDSKGHQWAIPADDLNVNLHEDRNIFELPRREPGFYYQYVDGGRLNEFLTRGFVLVDRDEIDDPTKPSLTANPLLNRDSSHHQIGNAFLVKIPQVLADRLTKLKTLKAKEATAGIQIPRQLGKPQIGDNGVQVQLRETQAEMVRPKGDQAFPSIKE